MRPDAGSTVKGDSSSHFSHSEDNCFGRGHNADVDVDLAEGEHALRVEHFELDGYATLRVRVDPAR